MSEIARQRQRPEGPTPVLELDCVTGEVSRVILSLGHQQTDLDFTPDMLARAEAKHAGNPQAQFLLADATNRMERDTSHDAVIARHLTWMLTKPQAAPISPGCGFCARGGKLVFFDGDWAQKRSVFQLIAPLVRWLGRGLPSSDES